MDIRFRSIAKNDFDFLWRLHVDSLREYVEKTWGWDDTRQRGFVVEIVRAAEGQVVVVDEKDAGVWYVVEHDCDILLSSIRLLPEFQNRGIGTRLITDLLSNTNKPVRLQVLKVNPARRLYERLGFETYDDTETHYKMINPVPLKSVSTSDRSDTRY